MPTQLGQSAADGTPPSCSFRLLRYFVLISLAAVSAAPVSGQDADEVAQLVARLEAQEARLELQEALNEKLLKRIEALEAGQTTALEWIHTVEESVPDEETLREERESMMVEMREEYLDLQDRLDLLPTLSGYYDFMYHNDDREDSPSRFHHHRLSLHVTKEWDRWRLFSEVEFEHGTTFEGDGGEELEEARGEIKLEQSWTEYVHSDALTLRGGLILTPGYWNVNHYPNVVLSSEHPLMVRKVFRESFLGLMAYGTKYWDDFGVTYCGYVGNGQSVFFTRHDDNEGKAVGGKVSFHLPTRGKFDTLDLGLSMYHESPPNEDRVFTWGLEAQVRKGPWEVLSEFAGKDAEEDRAGFYLQPSYRFDEKWATFYRYDLLTIEHQGETQEHTLGVNFRPIPEISLKLEYIRSLHSNGEDYNATMASIAVAF